MNSLTPDDNKKINSYLTQLLYSSEEDGKASLMGKIYRSRLLEDIDNDMMLRLCSIVNKAFLPDLDCLEYYVIENDRDDYIRDNLNALGLLQVLGNVTFPQDGKNVIPTFGNTIYKLNSIGMELLRIKET